MTKQKNNKPPQPQYFSDHFKIDKSKLKELGVFDPILNFDTKVFVDPLLLKKSSSEVIINSAKTFDDFFMTLLNLVKISQQEDDKPWREAKRRAKFPEYKYTCIGYGSNSINGSGSGAYLNDKILQSAKDIVEFAKDDPKIFLILPLLEEGIGADIVSDMTQNIIDQHICEFTVSIMEKLGLEPNCKHKARNGVIYDLLENPFMLTKDNKKCPIKLLPDDVLLDLPLADSFDEWLAEMADRNSDLRDSINKHLGVGFFDETKKKRKESLLDLLKNDKAFFIEVLETLKNHDFSHYDIEEDWQGLHRWLKDSEKFIKFKPSKKIGFLNDDLDEIFLAVGEIIDHFKYSIENEELWRMFWTSGYSKLKKAKEFYSQMLFFMVANSWINSKDNNLNLVRYFDKETKLLNFKFSVLGKYCVNLQIKHSDNYAGLQKSYKKKVDQKISRSKEMDYYVVMNFDESQSKQLKAIKESKEYGFKVFEIDVSNQEQKKEDGFETDLSEFELPELFADFELPELDHKYSSEKKRGGKKRHSKTDLIKDSIVKPMFANENIKGKTVQQRANNLEKALLKAYESKESLLNLTKAYNLDFEELENAREYFQGNKGETIYKWCLKFDK